MSKETTVTVTFTEAEATTVKGALFFFKEEHERMAKDCDDLLQKIRTVPHQEGA